MPPILGQTVLYIPLASEATQTFVAATVDQPIGEAVTQPLPAYPSGFRAATVVGHAGEPAEHRAALLVYKQAGDPFRGDADALVQRLADVPYSPAGTSGTWMHERDAHALAKPAEPTARKAK